MNFSDPKQNGHPVTPEYIWYNCEVKTYTKEACDIRSYYSTLSPLSSNQNYQSTGSVRCKPSSLSGSTRQSLFTDLSMLRSEGRRNPLIDPAHDSRFESGNGQSVADRSLSQVDFGGAACGDRKPQPATGVYSSFRARCIVCVRRLCQRA